jgi:hypothetical protein
MAEVLEHSALDRWRQQPQTFITEVLRNPETGKPFQLLDAEKTFIDYAFRIDATGIIRSRSSGGRARCCRRSGCCRRLCADAGR